MGKNKKKSPLVRLVENVALLSILDDVPQEAGPNAAPDIPQTQDQRVLSFEQERNICTALAFIAGVSNDASHIMAVAVEEHHEPRRIHIKVAVNKSKPADGKEALQRVIKGFNRIFDILARVAKGEPTLSASEVFSEVIHFSRERILKRLRSKKMKGDWRTAGRLPLTSLLRSLSSAVDTYSCAETKLFFDQQATRVLEKMEAVDNVDPGIDEEESIEQLLRTIRRFLKVVDLDHLLNQLRPHIDVGFGKALNEKFGKLAYYEKVSSCLFKHAKTANIFREFKIEAVCYCPSLIPINDTRFKIDLGALLGALSIDAPARAPLMEVVRQQRKQPLNFDPIELFMTTTGKTLSSGKVHAEVQLLFHYENAQLNLLPRVIVSTKSACFLCNALFHLHGKYHIPSGHGKLYPGWLLPSWAGSQGDLLTLKLNDLVQAHNKRIINELLSKVPRKRLYSGNESVIFPFIAPISSLTNSIVSTVVSSIGLVPKIRSMEASRRSSQATIRPRRAVLDDLDNSIALQNDGVVLAPPKSHVSLSSRNTLSTIHLAHSQTTQHFEENSSSSASLQETHTVSSSPSQDVSTLSKTAPVLGNPSTPELIHLRSTRLSQGKKYIIPIHHEDNSPHVFTDFVLLYLECTGPKSNGLGHCESHMVAEVEWLSEKESVSIALEDVHEVCRIPTDSETMCQTDSQILLKAAGEIIRISRRHH